MCISLFDPRQSQRLIDRGIGFPVARYSRGLRAVMHLAGVLQPAPANMFDEATVNFFWRAAPLTPVQNEFCSHRFCKDDVDVRLSQYLERVLAGCPVAVKGRRSADLEGVCLCLLRFLPLCVSPTGKNVLPKLGLSLATVGEHKASLGTVDKRLGNTVVQHQQLYQIITWLPVRVSVRSSLGIGRGRPLHIPGVAGCRTEQDDIRILTRLLMNNAQCHQLRDERRNVIQRPKRQRFLQRCNGQRSPIISAIQVAAQSLQ